MNNKFAENPGNPINTFVLPFVFTDKVVEAVESIWANHIPQEHRLFLIDNSSGSEYQFKKQLMELSHLYINSYRNLGPAVAFNLGIQTARTEYITIISDDARLVNEQWFKESLELLKVNQNSIVSLSSIYPQSADVGDFYDPSKIYTQEDYSNYCRKYGMKREGFGLACAIAKKETWIKSGLFNESKYIYYIDGDFIEQVKKNNINLIFNGVIFHYGDASHKGRLVAENKFHQVGLDNGIIHI